MSSLSPTKRALLAIKDLQTKLQANEKAQREPIAIIGLGCRFPGQANSPQAFWELLHEGREGIKEVPPERWQLEAYYDADPDVPGKMYSRYGGFIEQVAEFDPQFFNISPREATALDPQQRLLLEVAWEALENANQVPAQLFNSLAGVFVGICTSDYAKRLLSGENASPIDAYFGTGNALSAAAGRLSYSLGLTGPSLAVDTACSSSLVAVHLACQSLRGGECRIALAGGVNLILSPENTIAFSKARMLAADGRCKTFDAAADGYVRGEGCGIVALKKLSDAIADGDKILALIRGSAVNQDGPSGGLTVPNGPAQQAAIRQALASGGIEPAEIDYIEAHGTGTSLGDPIEVGALGSVFKQGHSPENPLIIGSVKTNIGHLEAAAGIAGLIKIVLSLQHEEIPPHLHFQNPSPHIQWAELPIQVPTGPLPWKMGRKRRLAGVSSFGFAGTNAHVILEESVSPCPPPKIEQNFERPLQLLTLSAKTESALQDLVKSYEGYLTNKPKYFLPDICFTANTGRSQFNHRLAVIAESTEQLREKLAAFRNRQETPGILAGKVESGSHLKIAFLFTGQGSQSVGMGRQLYETQPTFKNALDRCAKILDHYLDQPLLEILYPGEESNNLKSIPPTPLRKGGIQNLKLNQTAYTQPALFALEYALAQLWLAWGIQPTAMMGHSVGEYVAACLAGVFSLEDGLKLIAHRAKLMQALPETGAMVAVLADEVTINKIIIPHGEKIAIAALNGRENLVISGEKEAIKKAVNDLEAKGIKTKQLEVSHAFHSPLMQPMLADFAKITQEINYSPPNLAIISNVTGQIAGEEIATPDYWLQHIIQPVQFAASWEYLANQGHEIFLEIGPKPIILGMGKAILEESRRQVDNSELRIQNLEFLPSLRSGQGDWQQMLSSLATLTVRGIEVDWAGFDRDYTRQKVWGLPTYSFQRQRYWIEGKKPPIVSPKISPPQDLEFDGFYQVVWQVKSRTVAKDLNLTPEKSEGSWLIFADAEGLGKEIAQQLTKINQSCLLIYSGNNYQKSEDFLNSLTIHPQTTADFQQLWQEALRDDERLKLKGIIYLWSLNAPSEDALTASSLEQFQSLNCGNILHLIQSLFEAKITAPIWLVTRGTQAINNVNSELKNLSLAPSPLWGLGKVIALENPELWGGLIDLDSQPEIKEAESLLKEIAATDGENYLAFRQGKRYVARLEKITVDPSELNQINPEASYLITGGLGEFGLKVAQWLANQGAKYLILMGRNQPSREATEKLQALEKVGVEVLIGQGDVAQTEDVGRVLAAAQTQMPPLRGIIQAAGILDDGLLSGLSWERFQRVLAPKVQGTWNLHHLTQDIPLDFFVLFSSVASLLGSPGQGNYAAANAFLDAFAHYRHSLNLPALSLNWGPLAVGMAATKRLAVQGFTPLTAEEALTALPGVMAGEQAQVGVFNLNWQKLREQFPEIANSPYLKQIFSQLSGQETAKSQKTLVFEQLREMSPPGREEFLTSYLQASIARIVQIEQASIPADASFLDLGMDSLMVMEAIAQLKNDLQLMLYPREIYERPRINLLARYLAVEFARSHGTGRRGDEKVSIKSQSLSPSPHPPMSLPELSEKLPPIAFILSSPRSGSTLLRVMLAGHPELASPPELHLLPFNTMAEREKELALSHLGEGLPRTFMDLQKIDAEASQSLVTELVQQDRPIPEVYALLQKLAGRRLLVDKSPTYATNRETLERAEAIFAGAKYVHLVRHPYAVIESFCRLRMEKLVGSGDQDPYLLAEAIWTDSNRNILDFCQQLPPERYHLVRYEDLVTAPRPVMEKLCDFLGVPFEETVLTPYAGQRMTEGIHQQSLPIGDPNFLQHKQIEAQLADNWKNIRLPRPLSQVTCRLASSFPYELPDDSGTNKEDIPSKSPPASPLISTRQEFSFNSRGLDLCLCSWGEESGPLILCLHGILEQGAAWQQVAVPLAGQGYRVVAPDLRGHGRSAHVPAGCSYNLLDLLGDVDGIAQQLAARPFILVGHSLGSLVAAMLAGIRPQKVQRLVLVEPVLPARVEAGEAATQLAAHLEYLAQPPAHSTFPDVTAAAGRLRLGTPALSESLAWDLADRLTEPCPGGVRWRWDPILQTRAGIGFNGIERDRYLHLLAQIQVPITLIYGDRSNFNRPEDLAAQQKVMPQARRIMLAGGHNLHLEAPIELANALVTA